MVTPNWLNPRWSSVRRSAWPRNAPTNTPSTSTTPPLFRNEKAAQAIAAHSALSATGYSGGLPAMRSSSAVTSSTVARPGRLQPAGEVLQAGQPVDVDADGAHLDDLGPEARAAVRRRRDLRERHVRLVPVDAQRPGDPGHRRLDPVRPRPRRQAQPPDPQHGAGATDQLELVVVRRGGHEPMMVCRRSPGGPIVPRFAGATCQRLRPPVHCGSTGSRGRTVRRARRATPHSRRTRVRSVAPFDRRVVGGTCSASARTRAALSGGLPDSLCRRTWPGGLAWRSIVRSSRCTSWWW